MKNRAYENLKELISQELENNHSNSFVQSDFVLPLKGKLSLEQRDYCIERTLKEMGRRLLRTKFSQIKIHEWHSQQAFFMEIFGMEIDDLIQTRYSIVRDGKRGYVQVQDLTEEEFNGIIEEYNNRGGHYKKMAQALETVKSFVFEKEEEGNEYLDLLNF